MDWYYYIIISLALLLLIGLGISYLVGYLIFKNSIPTDSKPVQPKYDVSDEKTEEMEKYFQEETKKLEAMNMEEVNIRSFDGLKLHAYLKEAPSKSEKTIICVHGYKGTGLTIAPKYSHFLVEYNYNILFIDQRGYGKSDGKYSSFGVLEREDLKSWVNYIIDRYGDKSAICLFGLSMGGNCVLTLCDDVPEQVKCIINDSGFVSAYEEFKFLLVEGKKIPEYFLKFGRSVIKAKAHFDLCDKNSDAREHLKNSKVPVMFIHSDSDNFVPPRMGKANFDACTSIKESHIFKGCPHVRSSYFYKEEYRSYVLNFLAKYL